MLTTIRLRITMRAMNALRDIRKRVFQCTQTEFASLAGVGQASVSRWENGVAPSLEEMAAIRRAAADRGLEWDDRWFFESPPDQKPSEAASLA
jgi:transcriptional regulator with XRE-family HTH domain